MNIVVCLKQVPDVSDIKWTKENNLDRNSMLSKLNLYDQWALDFAIKIKSRVPNVKIIALSMGPKQAIEVLSYAIAKGADRAILLSDKQFGGSDTLITSKILARAIQKYVNEFDLILTGQMAQDGDTAQVLVSLAHLLGIIDLTNVVDILNLDSKSVLVLSKLNGSMDNFELQTPALLAINNECNEVKIPRINDYIRAQDSLIEIYNAKDLEFNQDEIGIIGSPTYVYKAYRPEKSRNAKDITKNALDEINKLILENM